MNDLASSVHQPPAGLWGTFLQTVLQCLNLGIILKISVPEVGKNWNCSLTLSDDKLYHLTIDKLGTLFLCRAPIVKHLLIGGISSPRSVPLKTCRWGRDTIICFLAPPSVPSIMCGHKAALKQICICFRWSSSSHQTMPRGRVFRAVLCFQSLEIGLLPSPASLWNGACHAVWKGGFSVQPHILQ